MYETRADRRSAALVPGDGLLHPAALASIAVLILNDHWLKAAAPGLVTGKLSDFAGLLFFPLMVQAAYELTLSLIGRPFRVEQRVLGLAIVGTACVFAGAKLLPAGRDAV